MPNKQRYTNNVSNPLLKVINADSQLQENPTSTSRNLNVQLFGDDSGTVRKVAVNSSGHILTDIEPDPETGLATAANQTNGNQISKSMGSEDGSTGGTQRQIHVDGSGNQLVSVVSSVNTLPANAANSHITDDPANSFAVGLKGRTTIGTATTETFLKCDTDGHLQVDVLSSPSSSSTVIKANDGNDGSGTDRTVLCDGNGALIVDASKEGVVSADGTTTALHTMMLGNNSGNLRTIQCDANGIVSVDGSASTQPVSGTITANAGSGTFAVSAGSLPLPSGAATEATLANAEGHLGTIDTSTAGILGSHYQEGDAIGASDTGVLIMGRNGTNAAKPIHITNNGDVEVEIADFVKGQATKANSFPVVLASDQDTLAVEQSYAYGSEYTIINAQTIADGDTVTSGAFEIQSVKNIQAIISLSVSAGGSTNYEVGFEGSLNGSDFFAFPDSSLFGSADAILSTEKSGIVPVRYMKIKITNTHGSGSHSFTVKGSVLGASLAAP